jgi:hypothetical protein
MNISQNELKRFVTYHPESGYFVSNFTGQRAGFLHKGTGKRMIKVNRKNFYEHRMAFLYMVNQIPEQVDHINQDGLDNRWGNLREADKFINARNHPLRKDNTSGVAGITYSKNYSDWVVTLGSAYIGRRRDFFEACCLRFSALNQSDFHPNHGKETSKSKKN